VVAFLFAALGDALLGSLPLTRRVASLRGINELRNGRRKRQLDAFASGRRMPLARRLGLMHDRPPNVCADG
jgi:hypothetical protein